MAALALAGCTMPGTGPGTGAQAPARAVSADPVVLRFALPAPRPVPARRPNAEMARDFLDLSFRMESGRELPVLTRFEGPVRVRVKGPVPASLLPDLEALIARLRREAGLDIALAAAGGEAEIVVQAIPSATLRRTIPGAACTVMPGVRSWRGYLASRGSARLDWSALERRSRAAVFVPADSSPQELRDCLHEELAQALGPLNDLYRLSDSVFNDDNLHSVLTGFDMLMLRVSYAPELASGMSRAEVAGRLPGVLARLNPAGEGRPATPVEPTPRAWREAIERALGPGASGPERLRAADRAVAVARARGWRDERAGFARLTRGRLAVPTRPDAARDDLEAARAIFAGLPGAGVQRATAEAHLAALALSDGRTEAAERLIAAALPDARAGGKAALVATLMGFQADLLERAGRGAEAVRLRVESLPYALYGLGNAAEIGRAVVARRAEAG